MRFIKDLLSLTSVFGLLGARESQLSTFPEEGPLRRVGHGEGNGIVMNQKILR